MKNSIEIIQLAPIQKAHGPSNNKRKRDDTEDIKQKNHETPMDRGMQWNERVGKELHGEEKRRAFRENVHIRQIQQYSNRISVFSDKELSRILLPNDKKEPYRRRKNDEKTVVHWGQRKLMLSEIEFLTMEAKEGDIVVYAGSAPGNHTYFLSLLFPFIEKFILVDPSPFYCCNTDRIVVRQEFFTDEVAKEFTEYGQKGRLLFISDIRTACFAVMTDEEVEKAVQWDMNAQMRWHNLMQPRKSMLKFRLPWNQSGTEYLDGKLHLPVWGPSTTTEGRLITTSGTKKWDNQQYEEQMFHFNVFTRTQLYTHPIPNGTIPGLCKCFDCTSEVLIWQQYMQKYHQIWLKASKKVESVISIRKKENPPPPFRHQVEEETTYEEEEDGDIPTKQQSSSLATKPCDQEIHLMKNADTWEIDETLWKNPPPLSEKKSLELVIEAIRLNNPMCSKGRTLTSKLLPPEQRKWYQPRRFIDNQVVVVSKSDRYNQGKASNQTPSALDRPLKNHRRDDRRTNHYNHYEYPTKYRDGRDDTRHRQRYQPYRSRSRSSSRNRHTSNYRSNTKKFRYH